MNIQETNDLSELKQVQDKLIEQNPQKYTRGTGYGIEKKIRLNSDLCVSLIWIYKFYRHSEFVDIENYYTKKDFFFDLGTSEHKSIIKNYTQLRHWDLIAPMPTHPTEIKHKRGWYGITDYGIKFCQRELAMPKYAIIQNNMAIKHITIPVMIDDVLRDSNLVYDDLININN